MFVQFITLEQASIKTAYAILWALFSNLIASTEEILSRALSRPAV